MFVELVELLRCPQPHADVPLVLAIESRDGGYVREGLLGCPGCEREYPIRAGIVMFDDAPLTPPVESFTLEELGGFLNPSAGAIVGVTGAWATAAHALADVVPLRGVIVNAPAPLPRSEFLVQVSVTRVLPLAREGASGVALSAGSGFSSDEGARVLRPGGRLIAPGTEPVPGALARIAADERVWIAERPPATVPLLRRKRGIAG